MDEETMNDFLHRHGISLRTERGQHFLHNELVIDRMIDEGDITGEDTVLEIGAGIGSITKKLAERAGHVIAVENDGALIPALQERVNGFDNVEIVQRDIMKGSLPEFDKCVSNIPFQLSSELLEMLGEKQKLCVLLFQEEFARRLIAPPGSQDYSRITIRTNYDFTPVYLDTVYDINFVPPPETNAAIVKLYPNRGKYAVEDEAFFFHTVLALFTHKGKKVRNAFMDSRHMFDMTKGEAKVIQDELPYAHERVFELSIKQLVEIANELKAHA